MKLFSVENRWPLIITGILVGNLVLGVFLIRIAADDQHFAVEPDYYQRALAWDTVQAQRSHNVALGWQLDATMDPIAPRGTTPLVLQLRDRAGIPLAAESATIEARPIAYAADAIFATATPRTHDSLREALHAELPISREGLWEFRIAVRRGGDQFTATLRADLSHQRVGQWLSHRPGEADSSRLARGVRTP